MSAHLKKKGRKENGRHSQMRSSPDPAKQNGRQVGHDDGSQLEVVLGTTGTLQFQALDEETTLVVAALHLALVHDDLQLKLFQRPRVGLGDKLARGRYVRLGVEQPTEPDRDGLEALGSLALGDLAELLQLVETLGEVRHPNGDGRVVGHGVLLPLLRHDPLDQFVHQVPVVICLLAITLRENIRGKLNQPREHKPFEHKFSFKKHRLQMRRC